MEKNPHDVDRLPGARLVKLQKAWWRIRKQAGIADVRLHDIRHSYASFAEGSGASLPMIGALLVHKHVATTARYTHLANPPVQQLNDQIGTALAPALVPRRRRTRQAMQPPPAPVAAE